MPVGFRTPTAGGNPFGITPKPFVLTDDALRNMATSANQTRKDGKERGFNYCIDPGQKIKGGGPKFNVLEAGGRCVGDECSVELGSGADSGCPPVEISWKMAKDVAVWLSPGQDYGSHHTHPGGDPTPSPFDVVRELLGAVLYKKNKAMGCITGATGSKGSEPVFYDKTDPLAVDPTICWVVPKEQLPDIDQLMDVLDDYNQHMHPMYAEWSKTGKEPNLKLKKWAKALETYRNVDMFTDEIKAEVHFSSLENLNKAKVRRQQTGIGDMPDYFDVQTVELQTLKYNWAKGLKPFPKPKKKEPKKVVYA